MNLIAHLSADAAAFSLKRSGGTSQFETPWHRAVLVLQDEAGNVMRSVEAFASGAVEVRGEGEEHHEAVVKPEEKAPSDTDTDAAADGHHADDADGFKAMSQHADESQNA